MGRVIQKTAGGGSQKWMQLAVNGCPHVLNLPLQDALALPDDATIEWLSPRADDDHAEYRDAAFINALNLTLPHRPVAEFWPSGGAVWDGLAQVSTGEALIVEAKAHLSEIDSPPTAARNPESIHKIKRALAEAKAQYGASHSVDWLTTYYQYANRLTHLYLLRVVNKLPVSMVFIYFVHDIYFPDWADEAGFRVKIGQVHKALGLPEQIDGLIDVFVDVKDVCG